MRNRLTALSDQLLTRLVPRTTAAASPYRCWWEVCSYSCIHRRCCEPIGNPGAGYCGNCQWSCG